MGDVRRYGRWATGLLLMVVFGLIAACSGSGEPPSGPVSKTGPGSITPVVTPADDIVWLGKLIASEAGSILDGGQAVRATDTERSAVAWTALNRLKAGTFGRSLRDVVTAPGQFAYGKEPTSEILELAAKLLRGEIPDPTSGATNFFSPIGMPKEGESTSGFDAEGGLHVVPGLAKKVYFPTWTTKLVWVGELQDVRQKYYMFYRPSGESPGRPGVAGSSQPRVVFQSRDGSQIFISNADGTGIRLIAKSDSPIHNVTWSPDGEKLAYTTVTRELRTTYSVVDIQHLWLLTSRGKPVELLRGEGNTWYVPSEQLKSVLAQKGNTFRDYHVAFAPDSEHLLFTDEDELYVAKSDGTNRVKVGKRAGGMTPTWSPDGNRIAYANEFYNLVVVNNDGTQPQRLVPNMPNRKWEPGWSPDGRRIVFPSGFIDLPSGIVTKFLSDANTNADASLNTNAAQFSPVGGMVAYYYSGIFAGHGLRVVAVDEAGKLGSEVARAPGASEEFEWSPDGRRIRFGGSVIDLPSGVVTKLPSGANTTGDASRNSDEWSDEWKVWIDQQGLVSVVNSDGTGRIDLGEGASPRWSPDGKRITYGQTAKFGREVVGQYIFVVNADGTGKVKIADGISPRWIPASSW